MIGPDSDWVDSLISAGGKVSSLIDFIEVEDVLLKDNEIFIFDCGVFFKKKIIDLLFVFEL
jgi:hypothetical protein